MPIPKSRTLMPVLLALLKDRKSHTIRALVESLEKKFRVPSRERKKFEGRVERALADLKYYGLIDSEKKGTRKISYQGLQILGQSSKSRKEYFDSLFSVSKKEQEKEALEEERLELAANEE